ncbi:zinc-dependent alcohol dehydrogenase [Oleiharenicola lentus]|uniref:zinc-dependent alcohol dehydrogenase n=1 Tax=Oleiharenicola lentus TaxID=2508720 RepID=UPI003F6662F6
MNPTAHSSPRLIFASSPPGVTVETSEIPVPGPNQLLVRNACTQVSAGSESNFLRHGPQSYGLPEGAQRANIGYMAVGRVVAVGRDVTGFRVGDRVTASAPHALHVVVDVNPSASIEQVPEGVTDESAGFVALGDVALHSVRRAGVQIDQSVAVFGLGMVGQLVLQFARISGAYPLIAIDLEDERLEMAKRSGATHCINASRENVVERIREITRGAGAEAVFHCAQAASILQTAMECAADRGSVVLTGSPPGNATIRLKEELLRKELTVTGTYEAGLTETHAYWRWSRSRNRRACLRLMATGELRLDHLLTHVVPVAQAPAIYQMVLQGSKGWLGIVFKWE